LIKNDFYHGLNLIKGSFGFENYIFAYQFLKMSFTYNKKYKLKSKKLIDQLFSEGKSVAAFPLRMVYLKLNSESTTYKVGVSVSKRNFRKAVDRNRIKRLLREAYRINQKQMFNNSSSSYALMILYIGKDIPDYKSVESRMKQLLNKFGKSEFPN